MTDIEKAVNDVLDFVGAVLKQFPLAERAEIEARAGEILKVVMATDFKAYAEVLKNRIKQIEEYQTLYEKGEKDYLSLLARYNILREKFPHCEVLDNLDLSVIELNEKVKNQKATIRTLTEQRDKYKKERDELAEGLNAINYI